MEARDMVKTAIEALNEKKAEDIKIIDISQISVLADYFIIASGTNRNQIQAMSDNVDEYWSRSGYSVRQVEGYDNADWIILDGLDVVVHIFEKESRKFYNLEHIWKDGIIIDPNEI